MSGGPRFVTANRPVTRGLDIQTMDIGMIPILARQLTSSADEKVFFSSGKAVGQNVLASWNRVASMHPIFLG